MTPEASRFVDKAGRLLVEADAVLALGLHDAAGRSAYLAAFHVAQALIFERQGSVPKTHNGVQTEFLRLTRDDPAVDPKLRSFLSQAYNLKTVADYETGPDAGVTPARAVEAVETAKRFATHIGCLLDRPQPERPGSRG